MLCTERQRPIRCIGHLLVAAILTLASLAACREITDFVSTNILSDGEVETRIYYKGLSAKETSVGRGSTSSLKLRQLTQGNRFVQLIYDDGDQLIDCDFGFDKNQTKSFLYNFKKDLSDLISTSNITVKSLDGQALPEEFLWMNYTQLREECRLRHREIKEAAHEQWQEHHRGRFSERFKRSMLIVPGSFWCGDGSNAGKYTELGSIITNTDKCCRRHDSCKREIPGLSKKYNYFNMKPFTVSHCQCDSRSRRDISDIFRVPGTKWCGKGYSADKYTRLGGFSRTDRCCRKHDLRCPFWIDGFETKYGLFNWRMNTLMHCSCDQRFRACLKRVGSSDANLVGKLFFNIVQTKCFVLKPKKKCMKPGWWGKCKKYKIIKQAILRDNIPY